MGTYLITDNQTGRKFKVTGDSPPTEEEIPQIMKDMGIGESPQTPMLSSHAPGQVYKKPKTARQTLAEYARPLLEGGGASVGAILGGGAGLAGGPAAPGTVPLGALAGGGLGYAIGKKGADMLEGAPPPRYVNLSSPTGTAIANQLLGSASDVMTGATYEMGGQAIGPTLGLMGKGLAKTGRALGDIGAGSLGISTGTSGHMIKEAVKASPEFTRYMRSSEHGGEQLVGMAKNAVKQIRTARNEAYQTAERQIFTDSPPMMEAPQVLNQTFTDTLGKFRASLKPVQDESGNIIDYAVDTVGSKIGKQSAGAVKETYNTIKQWTAKQDYSAESLDALRMQLDDLYKNGEYKSNVFIRDMRDSIGDYLENAVPGYKAMKSEYAKESEFLNNLTKTLSVRPGVPIDTTVRKLTQSMRDNFEFRKELLERVQAATDVNLEGAIAGYNMSSFRPKGVTGKISSAGLGVSTLVSGFSPQFILMLASTSPRLVGETLRGFGVSAKQAARVASRFKRLKEYAKTQPGFGGPIAAVDEENKSKED